ncbi:MAG TPA: SdrD B-like domain-containing protein [Thermoanaerobaculia bacterium]|nr:SdrD B-like domain-containing protein [Thermoanaerobaculia bacterium]
MSRSILAAVLLLGWTFTAQAAEGQFKCFPSCSTTDSRFLVIATGAGLVTLSDTTLDIQLAAPAGSSSFQVGVFDGDSGGLDGLLLQHWDFGAVTPYTYTLYADPLGDGSGMTVVEMAPGFPSISSLIMADNDWTDFTVPTSPDARSPSGHYIYRLHIELAGVPLFDSYNSFKLRTSGVSMVRLEDQPFSYMAAISTFEDLLIVYPDFPTLTPTTYDGTFRFFFDILDAQSDVSVWNGDFDRGKWDGTDLDTDDPDTPKSTPPWATDDALPEGVATGGFPPETTGNPADDTDLDFFLRSPSVYSELHFPDGQVFTDNNPSGNQEWEQFRISTDPFNPATMDASTTSIPGGIFEYRVLGVDLSNLNAIRLPDRALCVSDTFQPCTPLYPFLIGDTVFQDPDGNGAQSEEEPGIAGVALELVGSSGMVIGTATTDANGKYSFNVPASTFTVRVAANNSNPGGALAGTIATTPVQLTKVVVDDNVLTYDFGYRGTGSIGDRVWYDADADGVVDSGEPGLGGTKVELLNSGGTVIATTTTDANGIYTFANLAAGSYTVRVVSSTLPAGGLAPTYDLDGTGTAHTAAVTLNAGQSRTDVDFGYRGTRSLGDRVWKDLDGDGVQEAGEPGINGVTVRLFLGTAEVASTVTSGDGNYSFTNLPETTFTVKIDTATLPAGATQTYDLDGLATPHQATVNLTASRTDVDFGYRIAASCTAGYFKDHFSNASFSNNDGTLSWAGSWIESDTAGTGVSSGNVTVGNPYSGYLFLRDSPDTGTQPSAARQVNLSGFSSATLSFSFHVRTGVDPEDAVVIEISKNGGTSYTVLETLDGYSGTAEDSRSYNITSYIASNTRIRFRVSNGYGASDELFKVDWVKIDAGCSGPSIPTTGSAGNRVWKDLDGDGIQDSGEPGLNGVTVQLLNSSGTVLATQLTSGDGNYSFTGLSAATYRVKVVSSTLPSGLTPTYDLDGTGTAHFATFTLNDGQNRTDIDFGYRTPPACPSPGYFKDLFDTASFSNNNGTLSWAGAWVESDSAGTGVSSGNVTVGSPYSGYLFLRDYPDTGTQPSAARQANLSGYVSATLSFSFHVRTAVDPDDAVVVEISKNGGTSYTVLETLDGFTGTATASRSYDISPYIASNTRIRFRVSNNYGASDELFKLDWVKIDAACQ